MKAKSRFRRLAMTILNRVQNDLTWLCPDHLEAKDERVFLLDESLHFRSATEHDKVALCWRDLSGDPGEMFKFVCDSSYPSISQSFELVGIFSSRFLPLDILTYGWEAYQCMWERKYHKSHDQATELDLEQFNFA